MDESRAAEGLSRIQREIAAEKAAALARIAGTLEDLIAQLGRETDGARHEALRERALRYRWYLEVQREAVGLTRHDALDQMYPIPPPLTARPQG
jgi:hypothetical protein